MRRQQNIYVQTQSSCVRNKDILGVNTSSDLCIFKSPLYGLDGGSKILTGMTEESNGVYLVTDGEQLPMTFSFSGNLSSFLFDDVTFKYKVYRANRFDTFIDPPVVVSDVFPYSGMVSNEVFDFIDVNALGVDGEYLVKAYFEFTTCTDILGRLGIKHTSSTDANGLPYGKYNESYDYYFVAVRTADTPTFNLSPDTRPLGALTSFTIIPSGQTVFELEQVIYGMPIVTLNGSVLAYEEDFLFSGSTIELLGPTDMDDIMTVVFVGNEIKNGLVADVNEVNGMIASGPTDYQGKNRIYYNTTTNKYEIFTKTNPTSKNDVIITINGAALAKGVDFYQSTSNVKRFILEGSLFDGDIITVIYNGAATTVDYINDTQFPVYWQVEHPPQVSNGKFTLQVAVDEAFTGITYSAVSTYVVGQKFYSATAVVEGDLGSKRYYRVLNEKDFVTIGGGIIHTEATSEVIPIIINTNSQNSY